MGVRLFHFSDDPAIGCFTPHVPGTNPSQPPQVWAIDDAHQSLYWFPRECPRLAVWTHPGGDATVFHDTFATTATRVHAVEGEWGARLHGATIHRYELPVATFRPWTDATGQWVSEVAVEPLARQSLTDLHGLHVAAGIELRVVPSLWPLVDLVTEPAHARHWDFSIVRLANAQPRPTSLRPQL